MQLSAVIAVSDGDPAIRVTAEEVGAFGETSLLGTGAGDRDGTIGDLQVWAWSARAPVPFSDSSRRTAGVARSRVVDASIKSGFARLERRPTTIDAIVERTAFVIVARASTTDRTASRGDLAAQKGRYFGTARGAPHRNREHERTDEPEGWSDRLGALRANKTLHEHHAVGRWITRVLLASSSARSPTFRHAARQAGAHGILSKDANGQGMHEHHCRPVCPRSDGPRLQQRRRSRTRYSHAFPRRCT